MGHDVFVSHSSKDKVAADSVCAALEANGIRCWMAPRDIMPGENWAASILKGVSQCRLMVLVFSGHTNSSQHVRREVERAVHHGIPIAPIRIQDALPAEELEYFLSSSHWMDALTPPFERHLQQLAAKTRVLLEMQGKSLPPAPKLAPSPPAALAPTPRGSKLALVLLGVVVLIGLAAWIWGGDLPRLWSKPGTPILPKPSDKTNTNDGAQKFTNSIGMTLIEIKPGEFLMGSRANEEGHSENETQHKVKITKSFMLSITPVTQKQWVALMGNNPSNFKGDDLPVETVSWDDAVVFCQRLGAKEGKKYRLPTEAEWEYACRAGTTTQYNTGDGEKAMDDAGWYNGNSGNTTHPVGQKKANAWGLYDMHGNVWQWCNDYYGPYPAGDAIDPTGPAQGDVDSHRVLRGGSWSHGLQGSRAAHRFWSSPGFRGYRIGFRCLLDVPSQLLATATPAAPAHTPAAAPSAPPDRINANNSAQKITNSIGMTFIEIKPGEFLMGSPANEVGRNDNETQHKVKITKPFMMQTTHVTRGQFAVFVKDSSYQTEAEKEGSAFAFDGTNFGQVKGASWKNPGFEQTDDHPVVEVSWNDAQAFCQWLSKKESKTYRLPTEAQFEYASRAGSQGAYFWGDNPDDGNGFANCADLTAKDNFPAWPTFKWRDGFIFTSPVGSFKPNPFGLYDMIGNAWEWCNDYYGLYPAGDAIDPTGPAQDDTNSLRVLHGGSWHTYPQRCRAAVRIRASPGYRDDVYGFRCILDVP